MARKVVKAKSVAQAPGGKHSNVIAAVAYLLGFVSGVLVYLLKRDDSFARFHAVQSIIWFVLLWVINGALVVSVVGAVLIPIVTIIAVLSWLWLMYKALVGARYKIPYVGDWAEKYV